jgi:outer membrane protein TolC
MANLSSALQRPAIFGCLSLLLTLAVPGLACAQSQLTVDQAIRNLQQSPLQGSVTSGRPTGSELPLSLTDAINRGLQHNLGVILGEQGRATAEASRRRVLSELLPRFNGQLRESIQKVNLAAFGFSGFPGVSELVGPFSVFDARVTASQSLVDIRASRNYRAADQQLQAVSYSYQNTRDLVVLVVAGLYLQALAGQSRIDAVRAELQFAETSYNHAVNLKNSGLVPAIDVLRAQVERQSVEQRLIVAENDFEKDKLNLARAIGVPPSQAISLAQPVPYVPLPVMTAEQALTRAYEGRSDYRSALTRVKAAETSLAAARAARYPVVSIDGDYGLIGRNVHDSRATFTAAATVRFPIFQGGRIKSDIRTAEITLAQRQAEAEDLQGSIESEVRTDLLDVQAAARQVEVARSSVDLSEQQLEQAQDRFVSGIVNNLEVVQAQEAVAQAHENYISSLNAFNLAKAQLAKAMGLVEKAYREFLLGEKP